MIPLLLHARIVLGNVASVTPAANKPELLLMVPPPATTDQVGVSDTTAPLMSVPTAANCWGPLGGRMTGLGVTAMATNWPAGGAPWGPRLCSHAAASSAANGATMTKGASRGVVSVRNIGSSSHFVIDPGAFLNRCEPRILLAQGRSLQGR